MAAKLTRRGVTTVLVLILSWVWASASASQAVHVVRTTEVELITRAVLQVPDDIATVSGGYFGPDGSLVLFQGNRAPPLLYDRTLKRSTLLGRTGEGPGEFRNPTYAMWMGDSVGIYDNVLKRVSFFSGSGRYLGSIPTSDWPRGFLPVTKLQGGRWLVVQSHDEKSLDSMRIALLGSTQAVVDRIIATRQQSPSTLRLNGNAFSAVSRQPFYRAALAAVERNRKELILANSEDQDGGRGLPVEFTWIGVNGEINVRKSMNVFGERISAPLKTHITDSIVAAAVRSVRLTGLETSEVAGMVARNLVFPAFVPPLLWLQADSVGAAWVLVHGSDGKTSLCRIERDSDAGWCAHVPPGTRPLDVNSTGQVLFVRFDDDGLPSLFLAELSAPK